MKTKKIKILVGIDEKYTRDKIVNSFNHRNEYNVMIFDRNDQNQIDMIARNEYDIYWLEYEDIDFEKLIISKKKSLINSYCIRKGLIRKAQLAFNLAKYLAKKPDTPLKKYIPNTYVFELDYLEYLDEALNEVFEVEIALKENMLKNGKKTKKFLLKPSMTNKGAEIFLFDSRFQLETYFLNRINASEDEKLDLTEWVIQDYIDNPLQLINYNKRKFHLRVYVLAVGNLNVYVYEDILALFSLDTYEDCFNLSENTNINMKSHITNTCVQLDNLDEDQKHKAENDCVKRFWNLNLDDANLNSNKSKLHSIFAQIKECVAELFECLFYEPTVFQPLANAFELYGFDFLLDQNLNCFFLEANSFPDFKQTGNNLNDLINCLFYQSIAVACDSFFNVAPVCETNKMHLVLTKQGLNNKKIKFN